MESIMKIRPKIETNQNSFYGDTKNSCWKLNMHWINKFDHNSQPQFRRHVFGFESVIYSFLRHFYANIDIYSWKMYYLIEN